MAYLKTKKPSRYISDRIPEYEFLGQRTSYGHLRVFGCFKYFQIQKEKRKKFEEVSKPCIFVGYTHTSTQYRFYDPLGKGLVVSETSSFRENDTCTINGKVRLLPKALEKEVAEIEIKSSTPQETGIVSKFHTQPRRTPTQPEGPDHSI